MRKPSLAELGAAHAVTIDGGIAMAAVAAIAAFPDGPRRDLEVATWVRRARVARETVAFPLTPATTRAEILAWAEFSLALEAE